MPHRGSQKAMSLAVSDTPWLRELLISTTHINKPLCGIANARRHSLQPAISICWPCSLLSASDAWAIEYMVRHAACMLSCWHVYPVIIRWCYFKKKSKWNVSAHIFTLSCGSVCVCVSGCMSAGMPDPLNFENLVWMHDLAPCRVMLWNH